MLPFSEKDPLSGPGEERILWGYSVNLESMGQSHVLYTTNERKNLNYQYKIIILLRIFVAL